MSAHAQPRDVGAGQKDTLCRRNCTRWATSAVPLTHSSWMDLVCHFWLLSLHDVKKSTFKHPSYNRNQKVGTSRRIKSDSKQAGYLMP